MGKPSSYIVEGLIVRQMNFLIFQRLEERFYVGFVIRIAGSRHADLDLSGFEQRHILPAGILLAAIGVVKAARRWFAVSPSDFQSGHTQLGIDALEMVQPITLRG